MRSCFVLRSVLTSSFAAALLCALGCASKPTATETVNSMSAFGQETARVIDGIDRALGSLDKLVTTPGEDLSAPFRDYSQSVAALDELANVAKTHARDMKAKGDEFFKAWEADKSSSGITPERRA